MTIAIDLLIVFMFIDFLINAITALIFDTGAGVINETKNLFFCTEYLVSISLFFEFLRTSKWSVNRANNVPDKQLWAGDKSGPTFDNSSSLHPHKADRILRGVEKQDSTN